MKIKIIGIIILAVLISEAGAFTKRNYQNYDRQAVSSYIWGIFSEQISNTDGVKKYFDDAYKISKSDHIRHNLALELLRSENPEEGFAILNELYERGFKLGRSGIYLYLNESKKENHQRSGEILDRIIKEMYEENDLITAATVVNEKITDNLYSFTSSDQFEDFFNDIMKNEFSRTYKWYFSTIAMQFYSKTSDNTEKISEVLNSLEAEFPELPYVLYRFAFDEYLFHKDFDKASELIKKMNRFTFGEAKYYSDNAELYASKSEFVKARNILLDGIREFPQSSLDLQLARLFISNNELSKAEALYKKTAEKYPDGTNIYQIMASEYTFYGKNKNALSAYEAGLKKNPDDPELLNNYSYQLAVNSKDLDKALEYVDKALQSRIDSITFLDTKAWVLYKMGRITEAEKIMDKIFEDKSSYYHSSSEELYEHLKEIKTAVNKTDELKSISINKTAVMLSEIFSKSSIILQIGF